MYSPILFIICVVLCYSAGAEPVVLVDNEGNPEFIVRDEALNSPLHLEIRSIAAVTNHGPEVFPIKPLEEKKQQGSYRSVWRLSSERTATIEFLHRNGALHATFSTTPTLDVKGWRFSLNALEQEFFTGVTERVIESKGAENWQGPNKGGLNLRGQRVSALVRSTLGLYSPFFISSRGYSLFIHGTWPGHFDFGKSNRKRLLVEWEGPVMNFDLTFSKSPMDLVKLHTLSSGPPVLLPKWAFRPWRWRNEHLDFRTFFDLSPAAGPFNTQVMEDVLMSRALDIPIGVYWIDRPWAKGKTGYEDFEWDLRRFPQPEKMIRWLDSQKIVFGIWVAPAVIGKMMREAAKMGFLLPQYEKFDPFGALLDFTNSSAKKWWQQRGILKLLRLGTKAFKLDRGDEYFGADRTGKVADGRELREIQNDYPRQYAQAVHEACETVRPGDFALLARAGYTGSSRYAAFWGGDITPSEWGLRASIVGIQRAAIMGFPFWGSDTGGYGSPLDREVAARWLAFSAFSPIMEVGPLIDRAFWDMPTEPLYDSELIAIYRLYSKIHDMLVDYSEHHAKRAVKEGEPIIRPLFLAYSGDPEAWNSWDTFLYGDSILVSPIWKKGMVRKDVYLPKDEKWQDVWSPEDIYEGGQWITVDTPLHKIPLFIKKDASVVLKELESLFKESLEIAERRPNLQELALLEANKIDKIIGTP